MQSVLPTPEDDYRAPPAPSRLFLDRAVWDAVFGSIGGRLRTLEDVNSGIETLKLELQNFGIQRLDEAINPLIEQTLTALATASDDLGELRETLDQILAGGLPADQVAVEPIDGLSAENAQAAFVEVLDKIEVERTVTSQDIAVAVGAETAARTATINGLQSSVNTALSLAGTVDNLRKDLLLTGLQAAASSGDRVNMAAGIIDPYSDTSDIVLLDTSLDAAARLVALKGLPVIAAQEWNYVNGTGGTYSAYYLGNQSASNVSRLFDNLGGMAGSYAQFSGASNYFIVERPSVLAVIKAVEFLVYANAGETFTVRVSNEAGSVAYASFSFVGGNVHQIVTVNLSTQVQEKRLRFTFDRTAETGYLNLYGIRTLAAVVSDHSPVPASLTGYGNTSLLATALGANSALPSGETSTSGSPNEVNINFAVARKLGRISIYGYAYRMGRAVFDLSGSNDGMTYTAISSGITFNANSDLGQAAGMIDYELPLTSPAYSRYRLTRSSGIASLHLGSFHLFDRPAANPQIVSSGFGTGAVPSKLRFGAQIKRYNGALLSNLLFEVSRDNGTTWTIVPVAKTADQADGFELVEGVVDVSGQPVGSLAKYRIRSQNDLAADIGGAVLQWG